MADGTFQLSRECESDFSFLARECEKCEKVYKGPHRTQKWSQKSTICAFHAYSSFKKKNRLSKGYLVEFKAYSKQYPLNWLSELSILSLGINFSTISNANSPPTERVNEIGRS